jgi:hypothetical protein
MPAVEGSQAQPSVRSVLGALTKARLLAVAHDVAVAAPVSGTKDAIAELLVASQRLRFRDLMQRKAPSCGSR